MLARVLLLLICWSIVAEQSVAQQNLTWSGRWNNRKFGTSGPLKCVASRTAAGQWKATFTGTFQGDPFEYETDFEAKSARQGFQLIGKYRIDGHQYQWTGAMTGTQLRGQYRNNVGYNGEFVLSGKNRMPSNVKATSPKGPTTNDASYIVPYDVTWDPVIQDGERMLFLGNSYMANEGGHSKLLCKSLITETVRGADGSIDCLRKAIEIDAPSNRSAKDRGRV